MVVSEFFENLGAFDVFAAEHEQFVQSLFQLDILVFVLRQFTIDFSIWDTP